MVLIAPLSRERKMAVSNVTTKRAYELALDPATEKRKESLSRAEKEVAHLFEGQCFAQLVKEYKSGVPGVTNGVVRLMLVFGEPAGEHAGEFLGLGALAGAPSYRVAAAAGLLVDTLRQRDLEADGEDEKGRDPAGERGGGANDADDTAAAEYWRTQQRIDDQANEMLRRALGAVKGEGPVPQFLRDCAERVATPDAPKLHNITAQLRTVQPLMPPSTARIPFVHRLIPPLTERYPPPPPQSTTYEPRGYDDVLNEDALIEWREWLSVQARNMERIRVDGARAQLEPTQPLVLGQDRFKEKARGIIWDFRDALHGGKVKPLDYTAELNSTLNRAEFASAFETHPDQEALGMVLSGVIFKVEELFEKLEMVLLPHLSSLRDGFHFVEREIANLENLGYQYEFSDAAFMPGRDNSNGSVPKPGNEDRKRRVEDGGAPRGRFAHLAVSLNTAINLRGRAGRPRLGHHGGLPAAEDEASGGPAAATAEVDEVDQSKLAPMHWLPECTEVVVNEQPARTIGERKWPRERKPSIQDVRRDNAILRHASEQGFGPLYTMVSDWAMWFNQLAVHPSQLWLQSFIWLDRAGHGDAADSANTTDERSEADDQEWRRLRHWVQMRLGFGGAGSSGISQRVSEMLLEEFRRCFDLEEEPRFERMLKDLPGDDPRVRWIQARRTLSRVTGHNECRLYSIFIYTDDGKNTVAGTDRFVRALGCFRGVAFRFCVDMADTKLRIGTAACWIGFDDHANAGLVTIPPEKLVSMLEPLSRLVRREPVMFDEYRTLNGRLEHIRPALDVSRTAFYHHYGGIYNRGLLLGPESLVQSNPERLAQWTKWQRRLLSSAGCVSSQVLDQEAAEAPLELNPATIVWHWDAAKEGAVVPGIGGYCHGYYFSYALTERDLKLFITALEFLGACAATMIFGPLSMGAEVVGRGDAEVVDYVLNRQAASAPMMQFVHEQLLELPELKLPQRIKWEHINGEANPLADAPSRGEFEAMTEMASLLGVKLRRLDVPDEFLRLVDRVHEFAARQDEEGEPPRKRLKPTNGVRIGEASNEGPRIHTLAPQQEAVGEPPRRRLKPTNGLRIGEASHPGPFILRAGWQAMQPPRQPGKPRQEASNGGPLILRAGGQGGQLPRPSGEPEQKGACRALVTAPIIQPIVLHTVMASPPPSRKRSRSVSDRGSRAILRAGAHHAGQAERASGDEVVEPTSRRRQIADVSEQDDASGENARWALRPRDPTVAAGLERRVTESVNVGVPANTLKAEKVAWKYWCRYCDEVYDTDPLRLDRAAHAGLSQVRQQNEITLQTGFVVWLANGVVPPRSKADSEAKPDSFFNHLVSIRRFHRRCHRVIMVRPLSMAQILRSQVATYVKNNGWEALLPKRKEPISNAILVRLLEVEAGTMLGRTRLDWDSILFVNLSGMMCTTASGGFRKAEVTLPAGEVFDNLRLSRASLRWLIRGIMRLAPSVAELQALALGDYAVLVPPPSKADQFGVYFGSRPLWLPFVAGCVRNAAAALARIEIRMPVEPEARASTPLFVMDARFTPFSASKADTLLKHLLEAIMSIEESMRYSWHSFRIGLACSLLAMGAPPALIQAMCRWKSAESLVIYARMNAESYGGWVIKASSALLSSVQTNNLPVIDDDGTARVLRSLQGMDWANSD